MDETREVNVGNQIVKLRYNSEDLEKPENGSILVIKYS